MCGLAMVDVAFCAGSLHTQSHCVEAPLLHLLERVQQAFVVQQASSIHLGWCNERRLLPQLAGIRNAGNDVGCVDTTLEGSAW